jgi:hypothetical protein
MSIANHTICDGCGEILYGKKGIHFIKKDYIQIKGQITVHEVDKTTDWISHLHMTPTENEDLSLCKEMDGIKLDCLQSYIDSRSTFVKTRIEANKRNRASEELREAQEYGYAPRYSRGTKGNFNR